MEIRVFEGSDEQDVISLWSRVFDYREPRNEPARVIRQKIACSPNAFSSQSWTAKRSAP
jgi:hypothetical protein